MLYGIPLNFSIQPMIYPKLVDNNILANEGANCNEESRQKKSLIGCFCLSC